MVDQLAVVVLVGCRTLAGVVVSVDLDLGPVKRHDFIDFVREEFLSDLARDHYGG